MENSEAFHWSRLLHGQDARATCKVAFCSKHAAHPARIWKCGKFRSRRGRRLNIFSMRPIPIQFALLAALLSIQIAPSRALRAADAPVDFSRDIEPILSDACYHCHGPDEKGRKAKLRFDTKEGAFRIKDGKAVIAPGKLAESELIRRISTTDPDDQMPPPDSNRKLSAKQIDLLKRWVEQGAVWSEHWALIPPRRPATPKTRMAGWGRNGIDPFILSRLEKEGLSPSAQATKEALIRRVTFDLTGLPPTTAEIDAFAADSSPDAHEKLVDRLLASPRYGERMAVEWLDIARYADTHGYQSDRYRPVWAYRDWVIKAFNQNLPFDQFATWQIAGDLLPNATKEQRLATAFNRLHMQNEEGGIVEEEFRVAYVVDRVNTFSTAFLGLTTECSRCHDHKYDPIAQRDFYSLFAFFQNIDESGQTSYFTSSTPVPAMLLSTEEQDEKLAELAAAAREKEAQLAKARADSSAEFEKWLAGRDPKSAGKIGGEIASFSFDAIKANKIDNAVDPKKPGNANDNPALVEGKFGKAAALSGENGFTFPGLGHFTRSDPFTLSIWVSAAALQPLQPRALILHQSKAPIDAGSRGYEILLEGGRVAFGLHHMWPGNSLKVATRAALLPGQWAHLAVSYDGSSRAAGVRICIDGKAQELEIIRDGLSKDIAYGGGEPDLAIGHRFRDNGFKGGKVDEFRIFDRALSNLEIEQLAGLGSLAGALAAPADQLGAAQRQALLDYFNATANVAAIKIEQDLRQARHAWSKAIDAIPEIMVMKEMPAPKPAFILKRGAYDAPGEAVSADTPRALPHMAADLPKNRFGLAKWLTAPDHPLMARVTVNRAWQQMFGRGLVLTSDNFGKQGSPPTHPELLDYLARTFVDDLHWDYKALLRLMATSATYRQSSRLTPDLLARDPQNELLARGTARRLTAEMLRDQALSVSGLLVEKIGGPSVKPYQPPGLWEEIAMGHPQYGQGKGDDLHRRSLYTFWKRTVPPPAMMTFDAADRSYCTARRQSTATPLQALAMLNDVQLIEAARLIAGRMLEEGGATDAARVGWAFRTITGRRATEKELPILQQILTEQREIFKADPSAAKKLLAMGEAKSDPKLDLVELAAGTILAQALLNHDEAIMRR